jgi:hypothetical protein
MSNTKAENNTPTHEKSDDHDVIYTLRTAHQNQTQLILMADKKAHILIGVISVILTILFTKFDLESNLQNNLIIPFGFFIILEIASVLLALLVIVPSTKQYRTPKDIRDIPNPLFFGFFTNYSQDEYVSYLLEALNNNASTRKILAADLYQIGQVLKKKYRLLRYSYIFSIIGIFLPLISSLIILYFN